MLLYAIVTIKKLHVYHVKKQFATQKPNSKKYKILHN